MAEVRRRVARAIHGWYWWLVVLGLCWPLVHLAVFAARFGDVPSGGVAAALVFSPMGLVSAPILAFFLWRARSHNCRVSTATGYLVASPCAFCGSLMSGLMLTQPTGVLIYGAIPLIAGTVAGYIVGRVWDRTESSSGQ